MNIVAYNNGSKSAKALAAALGVKLIRHDGKPLKLNGYIINWGFSDFDRIIEAKGVLNPRAAICKALNKLTTFNELDGEVSLPDWTDDPNEAKDWLENGHCVVARQKLSGHSGEGIVILEKGDDFVQAPLYTKYVKKAAEYRVHVFRGNPFFVQKKARKLDVPDEEVNWQVRNLKGGFIYANQNVVTSPAIIDEAVKAVEGLGLDFGAVDIIEKKDGTCYVLEVNTACGLEGTTLDKYVEQFKQFQGK